MDHVPRCFRVGTRRSCRKLPLHRSMYLYPSRRPERAILRKRIREIAETRGRVWVSADSYFAATCRLACRSSACLLALSLERLHMRHIPPRRRVMAKFREDRITAAMSNDRWSMDRMYDQLFDGDRLWVLTVVDNFSRICPALWVRHQAKTSDVISTSSRAIVMFVKPRSIGVGNGSQFTSREFDLCE